MKLSEKLIKLRKEKGLSQEELGNEINVSRQAISKWESETAKPDIDKIKILSKFYNVSCDYLLNDEIDEYKKENNSEIEINKKIENRKIFNKFFKSNIFKFIICIIIIYLLVSLYKLIVLMRFHLIAKSFSEENYLMSLNIHDYSTRPYTENMMFNYLVKDDQKIIKTYIDDEFLWKNTNYPISIEYTDYKNKKSYSLNWNKNIEKYEYFETTADLSEKRNLIKDYTVGNTSFINILYTAFNPYVYYVSPFTRTVICYFPSEQTTQKVTYTKDGLISNSLTTSKDGKIIEWTYSYDYVPEHFEYIEIVEPLLDENYNSMILYE